MGNGSVAMLTNVVVTVAESPGLMMTMLTMVIGGGDEAIEGLSNM